MKEDYTTPASRVYDARDVHFDEGQLVAAVGVTTPSDPWLPKLKRFLVGKSEVPARDVCVALAGAGGRSKRNEMRAATCLRALGWTRVRVGDARTWRAPARSVVSDDPTGLLARVAAIKSPREGSADTGHAEVLAEVRALRAVVEKLVDVLSG